MFLHKRSPTICPSFFFFFCKPPTAIFVQLFERLTLLLNESTVNISMYTALCDIKQSKIPVILTRVVFKIIHPIYSLCIFSVNCKIEDWKLVLGNCKDKWEKTGMGGCCLSCGRPLEIQTPWVIVNWLLDHVEISLLVWIAQLLLVHIDHVSIPFLAWIHPSAFEDTHDSLPLWELSNFTQWPWPHGHPSHIYEIVCDYS